MPDVYTLGRTTQIGPETNPGSPVAATKQLTDLTVSVDPAYTVTNVRGTGRRFDASVNPDGQEHVTGKVGGGLGYNSLIYLLTMMFGSVSPTTGVLNAAGTSVTGNYAKQWQWIPPLTGAVVKKSFTLEQGDANDAEQVPFVMLTDLGIDLTRAGVTPSGNIIGQAINKAGSGSFTGMSGGTSAVPIVPVLPIHWNAFMDDSNTAVANLTTNGTKLTRAFHGAVNMASLFTPFYPIDASVTTYAGLADNPAQTATCLLELMKDSVGEGLWNKARAGQKKWIRYQAKSNNVFGGVQAGSYADNFTTLTVTGAPTGGTFFLTYKGVPTATIPYNATAAQVASALTAASSVGTGNVQATGGPFPGTPIVITMSSSPTAMAGPLANDPSAITATSAGLTPSGTVTPVQTLVPYILTIDVCAEVRLPGPMADSQSLRVRQWDFTLVEDPSWGAGQAIVFTLQNGMAAL